MHIATHKECCINHALRMPLGHACILTLGEDLGEKAAAGSGEAKGGAGRAGGEMMVGGLVVREGLGLVADCKSHKHYQFSVLIYTLDWKPSEELFDEGQMVFEFTVVWYDAQ